MPTANWTRPVICVLLAAATWFVFHAAVHYPFVNYDDPAYVSQNGTIMRGLTGAGVAWVFTHPHGGNWHPLTSISHMIDVQLFGLRPGGHHLINVLLHAANAILLFLLLYRLTNSTWRSAFVAAVFAVHPLHVESVAWIAERKDVLSGLLFILTIGAYVRYVKDASRARYFTVILLFALGLMAKPMLVTLPIILLLLDYWPLGGTRGTRSEVGGRKLLLEKVPLFVMSLVSSIATLWAQREALGSIVATPLNWRLSNAVVSTVIYLRQMFWPVDLAVFYPHPEDRLPFWQVAAAFVLLAVISAAAVVWRKKRPYFFVGWFWYLVMLAPVSGIVYVGMQGHADRYAYLPQIGLYLALAWGMVDLLGNRRVARIAVAAAAVIVVGLLAWRANAQTAFWNGSESLWQHALDVTRDNDVAEVNLSEILLRTGHFTEAIPHCEAALKIRPDNAQAYNNLALAYLRTGRVTRSVEYFRKAVELRPEGGNAALTLAWIYATSPERSLRHGQQAVTLAQSVVAREHPVGSNALHTLAAAWAEIGDFDEATRTAAQAMQIAVASGDQTLIEELKLNVENYANQLPLRDPGLVDGVTK